MRGDRGDVLSGQQTARKRRTGAANDASAETREIRRANDADVRGSESEYAQTEDGTIIVSELSAP